MFCHDWRRLLWSEPVCYICFAWKWVLNTKGTKQPPLALAEYFMCNYRSLITTHVCTQRYYLYICICVYITDIICKQILLIFWYILSVSLNQASLTKSRRLRRASPFSCMASWDDHWLSKHIYTYIYLCISGIYICMT